MALEALRNFTLAGLLMAACGTALAQNPHTSNGKNCGPWLATAPLSERIRQIETCKSLHIGKARTLAREYRDGTNGMPKDWAQSARWFQEAVRRGSQSPERSYGKLLGEDALRELIALFQVGGPGLPQDIEQAWRLSNRNHRPDIQPGLWELTVRKTYNGRVHQDGSGVSTACLDQRRLDSNSAFSIWGEAIVLARKGCRIEKFETNTVSSSMRFNCDPAALEGEGSAGTLDLRSSGDTAQAVVNLTTQPAGVRVQHVTTGRRIGDC